MLQQFRATARFLLDVKDAEDEGHFAKEYSFTHHAELELFMRLVEEARASARIQFAHANNELQ